MAKPIVIVALDVSSPEDALQLIDKIGSQWYKIGLELIYHPEGTKFVQRLVDNGYHIFLDAKLSDIPTTVGKSTKQICKHLKPHFLSVRNNIEYALDNVSNGVKIVHVPHLTSDLFVEEIDLEPTIAPAIVCRSSHAKRYRDMHRSIEIIVPGIRLSTSQLDEHQELSSSCDYANYIVVGRPITMSSDPRQSYLDFST